MKILFSAIALAALAIPLWPQEQPGGTIELADPSRPGRLIVSSTNGRLTIHGTDTKQINIATKGGDRRQAVRSDGLRRIDASLSSLAIDQTGNVVTVAGGPMLSNADFTFQVPFSTSLKLKSVMGDIDIDNINGDIEAESTNGRIRLLNVSGAAVVHGLNGTIIATFTHVPADKPMSFSSLNGDIDVTLPSDTHATLRIKTTNGDTYTDFDMTFHGGTNMVQGPEGGMRRHSSNDHSITGTINGGGPEIQFTTFNGSIKIRKGK